MSLQPIDLQRDLGIDEADFKVELDRVRAIDAEVNRILDVLDERREQLGMSKAALARAVDMHPASMRRLFASRDSNPQLATIVSIAQALDVSLSLEDAREPALAAESGSS